MNCTYNGHEVRARREAACTFSEMIITNRELFIFNYAIIALIKVF